jgi:hypothetical protein
MWHMLWMIFATVGLSTAGLLVIGRSALLVHRQVLALSGELDEAARRLAGAARGLELASVPVARWSGAMSSGEAAPSGTLPFTRGGSGRA